MATDAEPRVWLTVAGTKYGQSDPRCTGTGFRTPLVKLLTGFPPLPVPSNKRVQLPACGVASRAMPSFFRFVARSRKGAPTATACWPDHSAAGTIGGVQGRLDGRAVAEAEGLISLPDPPD